MRLRILPVYNGVPGQHYLVLDRVGHVSADLADKLRRSVQEAVEQPVLLFVDEVELPDVDDIDIDDVPEIRADLGIPLRSSSGCAYGC